MTEKQILFFEDDVARVSRLLQQFHETTKVKGSVLMDATGHVTTQAGDVRMAPETLAALVASSWAATRDVAKILPQDEFVTLTHQGPAESVQLTHVHEKIVLATVFDGRTTPGMIGFYLRTLRDDLARVVKEAAERKDRPVDLGQNFGNAAQNAIDDMFGEEKG